MARRRRLLGGGLGVGEGLQAWYDASSNDYLTLSSTAITQFLDRSGNGNDTAVQGTSTARPTITAAQQNGRQTAVFDGGDFLTLPSTLHSIPSGANTAFVVATSTLTASTQRMISMSEAGSSRYNLQFDSTVGQISFQSRNAFGSPITETGITETNYNIIRARRSGTTQALTFNNNTEATNANGADEAGCDAATIGAFTDGTTNPLSGAIAEILIYNRSLSTAEISQVETYLANKWGITLV